VNVTWLLNARLNRRDPRPSRGTAGEARQIRRSCALSGAVGLAHSGSMLRFYILSGPEPGGPPRERQGIGGEAVGRGRASPCGRGRAALDTNVLVRFLVRDDEEKFERAQRLIRREAQAGTAVLVSHLVLLEPEWVLRSRYKLGKAEILGSFSDLMSAVDVTFEDEPAIEKGALHLEELVCTVRGLPDQRTLWDACVQRDGGLRG
jgi:predicted nucleic acid-binding protein